MNRERALELVKEHVKNKNLIKHMLAAEAVMRHFARRFREDEDLWGLTGLVHDTDVEETAHDFEKHGPLTAEYLKKEEGVPEEMIHAVLAHAGKVPCESRLDWTLYASDPLTGFLVACALMAPEKKLKNVDLGFAQRRFKEKRFAMGASREDMRKCSEMGLSLDEFISEGLSAMQKIAHELEL